LVVVLVVALVVLTVGAVVAAVSLPTRGAYFQVCTVLLGSFGSCSLQNVLCQPLASRRNGRGKGRGNGRGAWLCTVRDCARLDDLESLFLMRRWRHRSKRQAVDVRWRGAGRAWLVARGMHTRRGGALGRPRHIAWGRWRDAYRRGSVTGWHGLGHNTRRASTGRWMEARWRRWIRQQRRGTVSWHW
jgi:hypothetical protein